MAADASLPDHAHGLQSLRGVAALTVALHHTLRSFSDAPIAFFISERILNAHAAVVVFFVLSGYVLSLSLLRSGVCVRSVATFYIRRVFRIYPALWAGATLGGAYVLLRLLWPPLGLSDWADSIFRPEQITPVSTVMTLLGVGTALLPPLWTIKIELLASLLLPVLIWLGIRNRLLMLLVVAGLGFLSFIASSAAVLYAVHFGIGALLAVLNMTNRIRTGPTVVLLATLILAFSRNVGTWDYHHPLPSLVEGIASAIVIVGVMQGHARALNHRLLVSLGDWSYSLYLLHMPIAFALSLAALWLAPADLSPDIASIIVVALTLAIAIPLSKWVFERIEKPGIAAGRKVVDRIPQTLSMKTS